MLKRTRSWCRYNIENVILNLDDVLVYLEFDGLQKYLFERKIENDILSEVIYLWIKNKKC